MEIFEAPTKITLDIVSTSFMVKQVVLAKIVYKKHTFKYSITDYLLNCNHYLHRFDHND